MTERVIPGDDWRFETWEEHYQHRLTLGLEATPAERLAWLEEVLRLAYQCGALPRRPSDRDGTR
jgi:hypothetical protein